MTMVANDSLIGEAVCLGIVAMVLSIETGVVVVLLSTVAKSGGEVVGDGGMLFEW